jgi:hypothetical protein
MNVRRPARAHPQRGVSAGCPAAPECGCASAARDAQSTSSMRQNRSSAPVRLVREGQPAPRPRAHAVSCASSAERQSGELTHHLALKFT